jgi:hypothetical protein
LNGIGGKKAKKRRISKRARDVYIKHCGRVSVTTSLTSHPRCLECAGHSFSSVISAIYDRINIGHYLIVEALEVIYDKLTLEIRAFDLN